MKRGIRFNASLASHWCYILISCSGRVGPWLVLLSLLFSVFWFYFPVFNSHLCNIFLSLINLFHGLPRCSLIVFPLKTFWYSFSQYRWPSQLIHCALTYCTILETILGAWNMYNSLFFFCTVHPLSLLHNFFLILSFPMWQVYYGLPLLISTFQMCMLQLDWTIVVHIFSFVIKFFNSSFVLASCATSSAWAMHWCVSY